jgi:hypothetical protein
MKDLRDLKDSARCESGAGAGAGSRPSGHLNECANTLNWTQCIIDCFKKVNSPTRLSTYCLLLLIEILSCRICGGFDFLKRLHEHIP